MAQSKPLDHNPIGSHASWDRRTIKRYIAKGQVSEKEYEAYLKALPDEEANGEWVVLDQDDTEITEDLGADEEDLDSEDEDMDTETSEQGDH